VRASAMSSAPTTALNGKCCDMGDSGNREVSG
jgi:hypothetical protein